MKLKTGRRSQGNAFTGGAAGAGGAGGAKRRSHGIQRVTDHGSPALQMTKRGAGVRVPERRVNVARV